MSFTIGGDDNATILDSVALKSVVIEKFESVKLKPEGLLLRPGPESSSRNATPDLLVKQAPVVITPKNARSQSNVTVAAEAADPHALLVIDAINARPSAKVSIETTEDPGDLIFRVDGQQSSAGIGVPVPFKLAIDQSEITGITGTLPLTQPLSLKGKPLRDSVVEVTSQPASLVLTVTLPAEKSTVLLPRGHVPVTALKFEQLTENGKVLSSLTRDATCEISYPDYGDKISKVTVTRPDFLWLDNLESFTVEELTYTSDKKGISVKLLGKVNTITSGSPEHRIDHRLTAYDALWNNHKVIAIFAVLCWMTGTTAAFYKFFKES